MSTRIVFNSEGFRQILTSEGCRDVVQSATDAIRDKAVENYDAVTLDNVDASEGIRANVQIGGYGGGRYIGFVSTADKYAAAAEAEDKILSRAVT